MLSTKLLYFMSKECITCSRLVLSRVLVGTGLKIENGRHMGADNYIVTIMG